MLPQNAIHSILGFMLMYSQKKGLYHHIIIAGIVVGFLLHTSSNRSECESINIFQDLYENAPSSSCVDFLHFLLQKSSKKTYILFQIFQQHYQTTSALNSAIFVAINICIFETKPCSRD